jgi:hypothetical protein
LNLKKAYKQGGYLMDFASYIVEKALILIPVLYIIGMMLKNAPIVKDWTIPWVIMGLGIFGGISLIGFNTEGVIQGILVAGTTVFTHQLVKQSSEKE